MKFFSVLPIVFISVLPAASAAVVTPAPAQNQAAVGQIPMRFNNVLLGNVARILSARFNVTVSIAANAKASITGDFSSLNLKAALAECARQAGLAVVPLGKSPSDGFSLEPPTQAAPVKDPPSEIAIKPVEKKADIRAELADAAARRAELLRERKALIEQQVESQNAASDDNTASQ
jgi:hypothetical protein